MRFGLGKRWDESQLPIILYTWYMCVSMHAKRKQHSVRASNPRNAHHSTRAGEQINKHAPTTNTAYVHTAHVSQRRHRKACALSMDAKAGSV